MKLLRSVKPVILVLLLSLSLSLCFSLSQEESHPPSCPAGCKICQKMIGKGLEFLAKKQHRSGGWCWDCKKRLKRSVPHRRDLCEDVHHHVLFSSLAILALLAEGSTPEKGKYQDNIRRGLDFLLKASRRGGEIEHGYKRPMGDFTFLQTGFALLVFSDIYLKIRDEKLRKKIKRKARKAIKYLESRMGRGDAWGYHGIGSDHVGMTYAILASMAAAKNAGFKVKEEVIKKAVKYLLARIRDNGKIDYSRSKSYRGMILPHNFYRAGGALFALHLARVKDTKKFKKLREYFTSIELKKVLSRRRYGRFHPLLVHKHLYGFFFATLGARVAGEGIWKRWFTQARDYLLKKQSEKGEWRKVYKTSPDNPILKKQNLVSRSFSTSVALITLQLPLGRLSFVR